MSNAELSNVTEATDIKENDDINQKVLSTKELVVEKESEHKTEVQIEDGNSTSKPEIKLETQMQDAAPKSETKVPTTSNSSNEAPHKSETKVPTTSSSSNQAPHKSETKVPEILMSDSETPYKSETKVPEISSSDKDNIKSTTIVIEKSIEEAVKESKSLIEKKKSAVIAEATTSGDLQKKSSHILKEDQSLVQKRASYMHRSSRARSAVGSRILIHRLSLTGEFGDKFKGARYMNTYKLDSENPFNPEKVQKILENVMNEALENLTYDPEKVPKQAKWASSTIRAKVKELQFDRFKIICLVTIGEKNSQDVMVTCRFLWDVDRDRYAIYTLENTYVFGIAQCFGLYYE